MQNNSKQTNSQKLLKPKQVSNILGISRGTLFNWRKENKYNLDIVLIGKSVFYIEEQIHEFILAHTIKAK